MHAISLAELIKSFQFEPLFGDTIMNQISKIALVVAVTISSAVAYAQSTKMEGMDMKNMDKHCMKNMKNMKDMKGMKGMDMKDMDMQKCQEMMKNMSNKGTPAGAKAEQLHPAVAVVKTIDREGGKVTLAHEAVPSLQWPPMTMSFQVKDKALFDKLAVGKKVEVELAHQGENYVVVAVK
jgi:Cu(I)/Ag(I) efflux system protein CusF